MFKAGLDEYKTADSLNAQFAAGIKSTGNAANLSVQGMNDLAESIINYSGQTDESIGKTEQLLQTFTNIRNVGPNKIFDMATIAAADMAAKMGGDASSEAIKLGRALQDPVKGVTALTRVGVVFTKAQKDQIAALMKSGDVVGAQKIILGELTTEFGGAAKAAGQTLPGMIERGTRAFDEMSKAIVGGVIPLALPAIQWITQAMKDAGPAAAAFSANVGEKLAAAIRISKPVLDAIVDTVKLFIGTITGEGANVDLPWMNTVIDLGAAVRNTFDFIAAATRNIGTWITTSAVPAIQSFVQGFKDGTGAGGAFKDVVFALYNDAVKPIGDFLVNKAIPGIKDFVQGFKDGTGPGGQFRDILKKVYEEGIKPLWAIITDNLMPAFKKIEAWIVGPGGKALGSFFKSCMELAVPLGALAALVLKLVGPLIDFLMPVLNAVAWVLTDVVIPAFAAFADETLAVCGYVVIAAGLVGDGFTWLTAVVIGATATIGRVFIGLWNEAIQPVVVWIIGGLASVMTTFGNMLVTLGTFPNMGWAKDAGDKVLAAAGAVAGFKGQIQNLNGTTANIALNVTSNYSAAVAGVLAAGRASLKLAGYAQGGTIAPSPGGTVVRVAEAGRSETIVDTATLRAAMAQKQQSAVNAAAPIDYDRLAASMARVQIGLDGRIVSTSVDQRIGGLLR